MSNVINIEDHKPRVVMEIDGYAYIMPLSDIIKLANGKMSIAEMHDPEITAQLIAKAYMDLLNEY